MMTTELTPIVEKLDALTAQIAYLAERQRKQEAFFEEMTPIARAALGEAVARLDALDHKGYFAFADEVLAMGRKIIESFSPDDVRAFGDGVVALLESVRSLSEHAGEAKPVGAFGAIRATRDHDVQKGLAVMIEVLRRVGQGVNGSAPRAQLGRGARKDKLAALLGPRRPRKPAPKQLPAPAPACAAPGPAIDISSWTRAIGETTASAEGVALTPVHWTVIDAARADYAATQASPNIRRLTQIASMSTKELYALFPKAPGRTIAKIAGLPKPAGCL